MIGVSVSVFSDSWWNMVPSSIFSITKHLSPLTVLSPPSSWYFLLSDSPHF